MLIAYRSAQAILERLIAQEASTADEQSIAASRHPRNGLELQTQANMAALSANDRLFEHAMHSVHLGEVLQAQGDLDSTLAAYRTAQPLIERLVARNPGNTIWQSTLMLAYGYIGNALSMKGKKADAVEAYRAAVAIGERLVAQAPKRKAELVSLLGTLSRHYLLTRQFADAKATAEKGYSLDPKNISFLIIVAHAEMFLGHPEAARELHVQHLNDVVYPNGNKTWKEVVADDFGLFKKTGLKSSNIIIIEQLLTKKDH